MACEFVMRVLSDKETIMEEMPQVPFTTHRLYTAKSNAGTRSLSTVCTRKAFDFARS